MEGKGNVERLSIESIEYLKNSLHVGTLPIMANDIIKAFDELIEYKKLEEQNRLLKLPCAIGDIVYWLHETEILPMEIEYFQILPNKIKFSFKYRGSKGRLENFTKYMCDSDIGKNVFLTKEESEAALKELERGKGE